LSRQPELHFALFQKFYKESTTQESHQEPSCRPGKPPGTHPKLEKDQTLVIAQPCLPQTTFSKLQIKPKASRIDPRSIFNSCNTYDHEGESFHKFPEPIRALK